MTLSQVWGALLIFVLSPIIGGLPLTGWVTRLVSGKNLAQVGTGNVGVSAAFYHGGRLAGILSVLLEAAKGIGVVLLAQHYFPAAPVWEIIALIGLVMGRYWFARGAGTTNVVWGFIVHDWITSLITFIISGIGFTIFRERRQGRLLVLILLPVITALRHTQDGPLIVAVTCLSSLIAWIYTKLPDDLTLSPQEGRLESRRMFNFFRGDRALVALDSPLEPAKYGSKAATLGQLRVWGYPVPRGYVVQAGDDPSALLDIAQPSTSQPLVVRSSASDEDGAKFSAAGIYQSFVNITDGDALAEALTRCFASYTASRAVQYRRDNDLPEGTMAAIVQQQVGGQFSGVAFSRDPIARCGDAVVIESLPGTALQVVSGQATPEQYRVLVQPDDIPPPNEAEADWQIPDALALTVEGEGTTPQRLLQQVAYLARHLEARYHGIPQDIEWSFDGEQLWLLQSRPVTTLQPIWTRKIAAEVIPGAIRPLTWSINRPLTCGVWGDIFSLVLGKRATGLDFEATATLHNAYAYFNASLLGDIFLRMGLPPESLEFLTRGAKFSRPPLLSTLKNVPGLLRLLNREIWLDERFCQDENTFFNSGLTTFASISRDSLSLEELLDRTEDVLALLRRVTYYNILAPLSFALRRALLKVPEEVLDPRRNVEIAALEDLRAIAQDTRLILSAHELRTISNASSLMAALAESTDGQTILAQLDTFIEKYGYLSPVGTDIAVATWHENPGPVRELLAQFVLHPPPSKAPPEAVSSSKTKTEIVQRRLDLKGRVNTLYNRLLAELRWTMLAIESHWLKQENLKQQGDIFFLTLEEINELAFASEPPSWETIRRRIEARQYQFDQDKHMKVVPNLVFGDDPPGMEMALMPHGANDIKQKLSGIGASAGVVEGPVRVMTHLESVAVDDAPFILVVPYTDAGWAPLLARAKGLIAEVGGRLSHGAIIAREYGIPAVMDIANATQRLHTGQWVRVDGQTGTVEVLDKPI
jgi:phosphoenolpyruvate synthase/pyruvate phosphate dikinase/glycerol-3-phosphate acyltransferase PlsY